MSTMNPLKFAGGMILEIGAVVAVLAILPGLGIWRNDNASQASPYGGLDRSGPNQVFFDARSFGVIDDPGRVAWPTRQNNDLIPRPPVSQQRYVENSLDHNSQRALDAASRIWNQGDRLLPPELRVRRDEPPTAPRTEWNHEPRATPPSYYSAPRSRHDGRY